MTDNPWKFGNSGPKVKTPYEYLQEYALKVNEATEGLITGQVTEFVGKPEITYAFYLVVPELRNYSYRLIEVVQPDAFTPYPVNMYLHARTGTEPRENINVKNFEPELLKFIASPITQQILEGLKTHIEIKREYN